MTPLLPLPTARVLLPSLAMALLLTACDPAPTAACPGLPDTIPSDWAVIPDGLDTDAFDARVFERMRQGCIPALAVSVVDADGPILTATWGYANLEEQIPATTDTPFMIASVSKAVDGLAIQVAQEQGLLDLDDEVSDLVGFEVRNHRTGGGPPILLRHLTTHSSGIRDNYDVYLPTYTVGDSPQPLGDLLQDYLLPGGDLFSSRDNFHLWPAGREWMYSNIGAALSAYAVQEQAEQPFDAFCREHVFEPLGMENTGWFLADFPDPDLIARPHAIEADGWRAIEHYGYPSYPDGQIRATAADMGQVLRVALGKGVVDDTRVLSAASVDELLSPPVEHLDDWYIVPHVAEQYLFWFGMQLGDRWLVGHDGDDDGVSTEVFFEPDTGVGVVLLTNVRDQALGGAVRQQTAEFQLDLFELGEEAR